jgi:hypothetical protein
MEINVKLGLIIGRPPLKALADVVLNLGATEITIHRCAVFEKSGQPPWANLPRLSIERNGKKQFVPLIDLPRELKTRVLDEVLFEYRRKTDAG